MRTGTGRTRRLLPIVLAVVAGATGALPGPAAAATRPTPSAGRPAAGPAPGVPVTAATALPVARPTSTDLGFSSLDGVLPLGSGLLVSHDGQIDLVGREGGAAARTLFGISGVGDLAVSPSGDQLFAVADAGIVTFSTSPWNILATWTARPCPRHPAVLGDRLYYAFGCPGTGPYGIAALALADGSAVPDGDVGIPDTFAAAPRLRSAGSVLVAVEPGSGSTVRSYLREADGTITPMGTATVDPVADLDLTPDGSELLLAVGSQVQRRDSAELLPVGSLTPLGAPAAVGYGPDLDDLAVGLSGSRTDQLQVRALDGGAVLSRSALRSAATGPVNEAVLPGSLRYSADGTLLQALVHPAGGHVTLLTATALPVRPTVMTLRLTSPRRYVDPVRLRLLVRGRPSTVVRLTVVDATGRYPRDFRTAGNGTLSIPVDAPLNGRILATMAADRTHGPGATSAVFTVPADFAVDLSGQYSTRGGVLRFRSFAKIRGLASGLPERQFAIQLSIQELTRRGWRSAAPAQSARTDSGGLLGITVGGFDRDVRYRLVVRFAGDRRNTGTIAYSRPFLVG